MSFGFSFGDFLAAGNLIKDIAICLNDAKGSTASYRELMLELEGLQAALNRIEHLQVRPEQEATVNGIKVAALSCRYVLDDFLTKVKEYNALERGSSATRSKRAAKKIEWEVRMEEDVKKLRAYLQGHTSNLIMMLTAAGLYV